MAMDDSAAKPVLPAPEGHSKRKPKTSTWHGHKVYNCPYCEFDSASQSGEAIVTEHIRTSHPDAWLEG